MSLALPEGQVVARKGKDDISHRRRYVVFTQTTFQDSREPDETDFRGTTPLELQAIPLQVLQEVEYGHIVQVQRHTNGRIQGDAGAARMLGMFPSIPSSRMKTGIGHCEEDKKGEISS